MSKKSERPPKSGAHLPYGAVLRHGRGLARDERRVRKILRVHGDDPDMALAIADIRRHYLALGRELRETVMFSVRLRREMLEVRELRNRALAEDPQLERLIDLLGYRAGNRHVPTLKSEARRRAADEGLDPAIVDRLIDDVRVTEPSMTPETLVRQADRRIDADLEDLHHEVTTSLEGYDDRLGDEDRGPESASPSDDSGCTKRTEH